MDTKVRRELASQHPQVEIYHLPSTWNMHEVLERPNTRLLLWVRMPMHARKRQAVNPSILS